MIAINYSTNHVLCEARELGCFVYHCILVPSTVAHAGLLQQIFVEKMKVSIKMDVVTSISHISTDQRKTLRTYT